jgi:hypothetical protein
MVIRLEGTELELSLVLIYEGYGREAKIDRSLYIQPYVKRYLCYTRRRHFRSNMYSYSFAF